MVSVKHQLGLWQQNLMSWYNKGMELGFFDILIELGCLDIWTVTSKIPNKPNWEAYNSAN